MMAGPNWYLLGNSLLLGVSSAVAACILGFSYALAASASPHPVRRIMIVCAMATLALPAFLVTNSWIDLLGVNGLLRPFIGGNVFSLGGTIFVLSLLFWPMVSLVALAAWRILERLHLEVDPGLRGVFLVRRVLWPIARPLVLIACGIVCVLAFSSFSVPAILQTKVYSTEAWIQFNSSLDAGAALRLCWPLILLPMVLLALGRRSGFPWPRQVDEDFSRALRRQLGPVLFWGTTILSVLIILMALLVPLTQLLLTPRTWSEFIPTALAAMPALIHSVLYALSAASIALAIGLLLGRLRWFGWLWIWFLVPGLLLGIGAVELFNRPGLEWFSRTGLVVIALLALRYLPLARSISRVAWQAVDPLLVDAARMDGASGFTMMRRILWPQIAPQALAVGYLIYLFCLWDVETTLLVVPPGGETLALRVFNLLHYGHNAHVNALCLLLLLTALAPLVVFGAWKAVIWMRRPTNGEMVDENSIPDPEPGRAKG
jgi:iron(III) transport system permease protein